MELFVGYQWYNPGGNVPIRASRPPFKLPSLVPGVGVNLDYNFTKYFGLEAITVSTEQVFDS